MKVRLLTNRFLRINRCLFCFCLVGWSVEVVANMELMDESNNYENLAAEIYDVIKNITDPEKPQTLEELDIISENDITIQATPNCCIIKIYLTPTVPHCSLATLIALSVRTKFEKYWGKQYKVDIILKEGTHTSVDAINKQVNDKERIAAAMENPNLKAMVEKCISDEL